MQLTESSLRKIIKEELQKVLFEARLNPSPQQLPDLKKGTAYGLTLPVLKTAGQVYNDNNHDETVIGRENIMQSIATGLRTNKYDEHSVNNWMNFLQRLSEKEMWELESVLYRHSPPGEAEFGREQANSPEAVEKRNKRATDNWLKTGAFSSNPNKSRPNTRITRRRR